MQEPDHEPLTDLTTVFFGLGIFPANAAFRTAAWNDGNLQYWRWATLGYLKDNVFGYALALRSWLREEPAMRWSSHLTTNPRSAYRSGLKYLHKTGECITSRHEMLSGVFPRDVAIDELQSPSDTHRLAALQRLWDHPSPKTEHIECVLGCLKHRSPAIQAEAINWLNTQETLPAESIDHLLDLVRDGQDDVPIQAAILLSTKCESSDSTPEGSRLLQELAALSHRASSQQLWFLIEPLAKYGRLAELAMKPFLAELHRMLIQGSQQSAATLIGHLLAIDPSLDARARRLWPETIVNLYEVAAKEARKPLKRPTKQPS